MGKNIRNFILLMVLLCGTINFLMARERVNFNSDWLFSTKLSSNYTKVTLPHCWNVVGNEAASTAAVGYYIKEFKVEPWWGRKNLFLRFGAASSHAVVLVNGKYAGEHSGGYTAFTFDITPYIKVGEYNSIMVQVTNVPSLNIFPIMSENYTFSGLYRDVELIVTGNEYITPINYGSDGAYLTQESVTSSSAKLFGKVLLNGFPYSTLDVQLSIFDGDKMVATASENVKISSSGEGEASIPVNIANPKLWQGIKSPFLYRVEVKLLSNGIEKDFLTFNYGIRTLTAPSDKTKFITLNGLDYPLRGVIRYEDGAYLTSQSKDVDLIKAMGANSIRVVNGGGGKELFSLLDKEGIVAWVDLPISSAQQFSGKGYVYSYGLEDNGITQLLEMVYQLYNHPSVAIWGLFDKVTSKGDSPVEYLKQLNETLHSHKVEAITVATSIEDGILNQITDIIAWPMYYGYKSGQCSDFALWAGQIDSDFGHLKGAVAEYGAPSKRLSALSEGEREKYISTEESQCDFHREYLKTISTHPYFWGTFVNTIFDSINSDGYNSNMGLISRDRYHKKDSYYLYKALWNKTDRFIELANNSKGFVYNPTTTIKAFTNQKKATLYINGKSIGEVKAKDGIAQWHNSPLQRGNNIIEVKSSDLTSTSIIERR